MKFDMNAAWNDAMAMIGANREVLLVLAGVFFLLPALVATLVIPPVPPMLVETPEDFQRLAEMVQAEMLQYWWVYALSLLAQMVGYLAMLALLRHSERPTVGAALAGGFKALLPAIAAYLLFSFALSLVLTVLLALTAVTGGIGALITVPLMLVGSIYVAVKVSLAAPVIAIEKVYNPAAVLLRSWRLTKGNSLRLFVFFLLIGVTYMVIAIVLGALVQGVASLMGQDSGALLVAFVSALLGSVFTVVMIAALAAAHRQLSGPATGSYSGTFG
ncbi:MAG: hypothetical protein KDE15_06800 [Erythrobacter sp.]|nr:hypothetical protein [Erythrobacter sp.]